MCALYSPLCRNNVIFGDLSLVCRSFNFSKDVKRFRKYIPNYNTQKVQRVRRRDRGGSRTSTVGSTTVAASDGTSSIDTDDLKVDRESFINLLLNSNLSLPSNLSNIYPLIKAIPHRSTTTNSSRDEGRDLEIRLNLYLRVDVRRTSLRNNLLLPFKVKGRKKVLVICNDEEVDVMVRNGAAYAGTSYLERIEAGWRDFDLILTSPIFMPKLVKLAKILGPLKMMPNNKSGTLCNNLISGLKNLTSDNFVQYRAETISQSDFQLINNYYKINNVKEDLDIGCYSKIIVPISLTSNRLEEVKANVNYFIQHVRDSIEDVGVKADLQFTYPPARYSTAGVSSSAATASSGGRGSTKGESTICYWD